jgi:hypothetical protein
MRSSLKNVVLTKKFVLDFLSVQASVAYGLRKLTRLYTGFCIRVRRSSDDAILNIGFDSQGNLDTATLLAFIGNSNGFADTWYDQSGNNKNVVQATAASQPQIVTAGVLNTENGKPTLVFDGVDDFFASSSNINLTSGYSVNFVSKNATRKDYNGIFRVAINLDESEVSLLEVYWQAGTSNSGNFVSAANRGGSFLADASLDALPSVNNYYVGSVISNGSSYSRRFTNGNLLPSSNQVGLGNGLPSSVGNFWLGMLFLVFDGGYTPNLSGSFGELIASPAALSTTDRQALERNQGTYFNIPVI